MARTAAAPTISNRNACVGNTSYATVAGGDGGGGGGGGSGGGGAESPAAPQPFSLDTEMNWTATADLVPRRHLVSAA